MSLYFETSFNSLNKFGEELCGDKVEISKNDSSTIMVLSDGLGSGVKANILATLTSKIVITMLNDGADIADVIETIASTLPVCKERQIAYSTFTVLSVTENGEAYLIEYDNPESIILRNGKVLEPYKTETSISGKKIKELRIQLMPDDICVMFSDGVVHAGVGQLMNFGWQRKHIVEYLEKAYKPNISAHSLQKQLLSACDCLYMQKPGDDATVSVCKVRRPSIAHIMVGPPLNKDDDNYVVEQLLNSPGKKAVCGGTTSQIVSRILGKELKVSTNYTTSDVPPMGAIDGIDIVTEGVVTLNKAYEKISKYETGEICEISTLHSKNDGSASLAYMLIEDCTHVNFYVGRANNPAHQNPDLPIGLNLKLRLVNDISNVLKRMGKVVSVEYY